MINLRYKMVNYEALQKKKKRVLLIEKYDIMELLNVSLSQW